MIFFARVEEVGRHKAHVIHFGSLLMLIYLLLFTLIAVVILSVIKASKHKYAGERPQKEPHIGVASSNMAAYGETEGVGKPRVIGHHPEWRPSSEINQKTKIQVARLAQNRYVKETATQATKAVVSNEVAPQKQQQASPPSVPTKASIDTTPIMSPVEIETVSQPVMSEAADSATAANDMIVIHIMAEKNKPYSGHLLLQALIALGLHYGQWNIFHRHAQTDGHGPILFSIASACEPGTFDLAKMSQTSTPGLVLFMPTHITQANKIFELLLKVIDQLVLVLGGIVCDEQRVPLTLEKLNDWRSKLALA